MIKGNICQECSQKESCKQAFEKLGNAKGPSVTIKSILAFLLPLIIFIAALGIFEKIFQKSISSKQLEIGIGFLLAAAVAMIYILAVWFISKHIRK